MSHLTAEFLVVALLTMSPSVSADQSEKKSLLEQLEGEYEVIGIEYSGELVRLEMSGRIVIKANKLTQIFKSAKSVTPRHYTISVDSTKTPAWIDLKSQDEAKKGETLLGVITIECDVIKVCYNTSSGQKRPTEFKTSNDSEYLLLKARRINK
jgi:uncharacterized protein (TIGR03067 family)